MLEKIGKALASWFGKSEAMPGAGAQVKAIYLRVVLTKSVAGFYRLGIDKFGRKLVFMLDELNPSIYSRDNSSTVTEIDIAAAHHLTRGEKVSVDAITLVRVDPGDLTGIDVSVSLDGKGETGHRVVDSLHGELIFEEEAGIAALVDRVATAIEAGEDRVRFVPSQQIEFALWRFLTEQANLLDSEARKICQVRGKLQKAT